MENSTRNTIVLKYFNFRFDSELDKNGDNTLNKEEILAWIIPSNEEIAADEVIKLKSVLFQCNHNNPG